MNGQDLYEGLRYVDPAMLEEAMEPVKRPKRRRYLPLAACLCLLLAGTAVAVFSHVEIRLLDVEHLEDYREADPSMGFVKNGQAAWRSHPWHRSPNRHGRMRLRARIFRSSTPGMRRQRILEWRCRELRAPHPWCSIWRMGKSLRSG